MPADLRYARPPTFTPPSPIVGERELVLAYMPLVRQVVRQLASQMDGVIGREDMEQIGAIGLLEALRRYGEIDGGFGSFARLRIRGAILDELRRTDWRPRGVRQSAHRQRDAERALRRALGRDPTEAEISESLGITSEAYRRSLMDQCAEAMLQFDEAVHAELIWHDDGPEQLLLRRRSLRQALAHLAPNEQRVIQLYYEFDMTLKEIAEVMALTEARICQINKVALRKMRMALTETPRAGNG
ncbi:FliA/WhiG family RNA polymerase sigma factor [Chitinasiproducens palmae]|uniref:RNA polymerase, sigma 28 subunit, SigD/FliA/WhiG n=1 Tax=Chitinasiproducens palmae TaxID=1770053 RepID=A0A1H2PKJ6_9BURK|nr:FliA/WhiG family RNA polymerase sigma factor [Chitinasiproducens palmae]SDV46943.1 RNA polymerase, sigma 28 subunit, SigD/FliA/WhiG [Chitinasiproducens palmae]